MGDYSDLRQDYKYGELKDNITGIDPLQLFSKWIEDARDASQIEPNAMTLATVDSDGRPHARVVLLKEHVGREFVFFSNYHSDKGIELSHNPAASLVFWWDRLERQVRIEGFVSKIASTRSDIYFSKRPRKSQIGAWASDQSKIIGSYHELESSFEKIEKKYPECVPRPEHWGGFGLLAERIEFWQGRTSRLHDRLNFYFVNEHWSRQRKAP